LVQLVDLVHQSFLILQTVGLWPFLLCHYSQDVNQYRAGLAGLR
jgi:hypothetical protein